MLGRSLKNNVFILDWDDTLFPTSGSVSELNRNMDYYYISLDMLIASFINSLLDRGIIYIVSAANYDWLLASLRKLPKTQYALKGSRILSTFGNINADKKTTFYDIYNMHKNDEVTNIVSIGDSDNEKNALVSLRNFYSQIMEQEKIYTGFILNNTLSTPPPFSESNWKLQSSTKTSISKYSPKNCEKKKGYYNPYEIDELYDKKKILGGIKFKTIKLPRSPGMFKLTENLKVILLNIDTILTNNTQNDFIIY